MRTVEERRQYKREWIKAWRKANPKKAHAAKKRWRENNREKYLKQKRETYARHRLSYLPSARLRANLYRTRHPIKVKRAKKLWYQKNRLQAIAKIRAWIKANRQKVYANRRLYKAKNPKKWRRYARLWSRVYRRMNANNPEYRQKTLLWNNRRRARKRNALGSHTIQEWLTTLRAWKWRCAYCGKKLTKKTATRDHIIALSRGGSDFIENIAPSCLSCNSSKGPHKAPKK